MSYIDDLIKSNTQGILDLIRPSLSQGLINKQQVLNAVQAETKPLAHGEDIHLLTKESLQLLENIKNSPDRQIGRVVAKILKSVRYAVYTFLAEDPTS